MVVVDSVRLRGRSGVFGFVEEGRVHRGDVRVGGVLDGSGLRDLTSTLPVRPPPSLVTTEICGPGRHPGNGRVRRTSRVSTSHQLRITSLV